MEHPIDWKTLITIVLIVCFGNIGVYFLLKKEIRRPHKFVYLPNQDLAAFTQIIDDSIFSLVKIDTRYVSHDMLIDKQELVGAYLIEPVKANRTILRSQLVIPPLDELTHQTRIVSILVSAASAWQGENKALPMKGDFFSRLGSCLDKSVNSLA